jgi:AraC family transcriptional regulator
MDRAVQGVMTVEAELRVPVATAQLVRFHFAEPADNIFREDRYQLDLCLTPRPRNARACFPDRWRPDRFERIGNVFLVPPGEAMRARSDECGRQTSIICQLQPDAMRTWFDADLEWDARRLMAGLDIRSGSIRSLLLRLAEEARQPGFASEFLVELIAGQLAIELARFCTAIGDAKRGGGIAPWQLRLIDERLIDGCKVPTLPELAGLCGLSVRQLTRGFRASRGCSIGEHVANSRVERAKRLLATDTAIKAIVYELGFASPSSFCFAFRRATGETPSQFRRRVRHATH